MITEYFPAFSAIFSVITSVLLFAYTIMHTRLANELKAKEHLWSKGWRLMKLKRKEHYICPATHDALSFENAVKRQKNIENNKIMSGRMKQDAVTLTVPTSVVVDDSEPYKNYELGGWAK